MEAMQHEGELIGESFGNYRLTRFIARGSMGEVFEGQHVLLGKRAAVVSPREISMQDAVAIMTGANA